MRPSLINLETGQEWLCYKEGLGCSVLTVGIHIYSCKETWLLLNSGFFDVSRWRPKSNFVLKTPVTNSESKWLVLSA